MSNKVLIIGAGGLAKQCLSTLRERTNYVFTFYDSVSKDPNDFGHSSTSILDPSLYEYYAVCLGDPKYRESFANTIGTDLIPFSIISNKSIRHNFAKQGKGCIVLENTLIEPYSIIGNQVLLNHGAKVFHDVEIGDYCEIMPGATLLGGCKIGKSCRIGSNATILPNIIIGDNVVVGAGAVVTKDVSSNRTVVGMPAKDI
jgi:sugar O-acyltransferase (sialic acid O-acetyltransferase NeuD family)